jgi:hypothetical protein
MPKINLIRIVVQLNELFAIDAQARQEGLSQIDRHVLRLEIWRNPSRCSSRSRRQSKQTAPVHCSRAL